MKVISGDLIKLAKNGNFGVVVHGCNCFHTMGGGIALQIKQNFPEAYSADLLTAYGDEYKLGDISYNLICRDNSRNFYIVNAYTQYRYGNDKNIVYVDYNAVKLAFRAIYNKFKILNTTIAYPKIGAGLANGNWDIISNIIDEELKDIDHVLVEYNR